MDRRPQLPFRRTLAILALLSAVGRPTNSFYRDDAIDLGIARFVDNTIAPGPARPGSRIAKRSLLRSSIGVTVLQSLVAKASFGYDRPTPPANAKQTPLLWILAAAKGST